MTALGGSFIVLGFAMVWFWVGAGGFPMPWRATVLAIGVFALAGAAWRALRRPASFGGSGRFDRRAFWVAVAFEVVAGNLVAVWLGRTGRLDYLWPAFGIIVALHFIGLYWASHSPRFIVLTVGMLAVNVVALFFRPGGPAMLAISGLGSATALALATVRR